VPLQLRRPPASSGPSLFANAPERQHESVESWEDRRARQACKKRCSRRVGSF
jgi:hypothetical protein